MLLGLFLFSFFFWLTLFFLSFLSLGPRAAMLAIFFFLEIETLFFHACCLLVNQQL